MTPVTPPSVNMMMNPIAQSIGVLKLSEPPEPMSRSGTAWRARKKARVTTNDGMPSIDTRAPMARPITAPAAIPASVAIHHVQS